MKQTFKTYFEKMGLSSKTSQDRLFVLYHAAVRLLPGEIGEVVLSQSDPGEGMPDEGDSLWFFSKEACIEARGFHTRDDLEVHGLKGIQNLRLVSEGFDLRSLAPESAAKDAGLIVEFTPPRGGRCRLSARGENCGKLGAVVLEYLKGNLT